MPKFPLEEWKLPHKHRFLIFCRTNHKEKKLQKERIKRRTEAHKNKNVIGKHVDNTKNSDSLNSIQNSFMSWRKKKIQNTKKSETRNLKVKNLNTVSKKVGESNKLENYGKFKESSRPSTRGSVCISPLGLDEEGENFTTAIIDSTGNQQSEKSDVQFSSSSKNQLPLTPSSVLSTTTNTSGFDDSCVFNSASNGSELLSRASKLKGVSDKLNDKQKIKEFKNKLHSQLPNNGRQFENTLTFGNISRNNSAESISSQEVELVSYSSPNYSSDSYERQDFHNNVSEDDDGGYQKVECNEVSDNEEQFRTIRGKGSQRIQQDIKKEVERQNNALEGRRSSRPSSNVSSSHMDSKVDCDRDSCINRKEKRKKRETKKKNHNSEYQRSRSSTAESMFKRVGKSLSSLLLSSRLSGWSNKSTTDLNIHSERKTKSAGTAIDNKYSSATESLESQLNIPMDGLVTDTSNTSPEAEEERKVYKKAMKSKSSPYGSTEGCFI
ncbi:hypothetical protein TBLA_0C00905 [Henningerozyma blattae CBS 6284]|uniref:Uncharacterized protein n=1 Tax=Henningerozyma blattae (strain ATCC 34711 / CBS 6284 / DSM 70876 / NBRC 10599 / NRRL Y-10934 / UCD 77-7) TaxID=1071380 RepID=I2H0K3_HENB6|nr:hypothetical protein TBLA_0C00905 [Tetrapisispora blattae CBS 6284]CCH59905.1 hypothetical protein TBLA_0C00905 [Tetrapisispora blattae CBS 6284]